MSQSKLSDRDWQPDNTTLQFNLNHQPTVNIDVIPKVDEMNAFFDTEGSYALENDEREELRISLYKRYDAGFYEPEYPKILADQMNKILELAAVEDGLTYTEIQDEYIADVKRGIEKMPNYMLGNLRFIAANSIVLTIETLKREDKFKEAGLDIETMEHSLKRMQEMRHIVIDEQLRRKRLGIMIE